MRTGSVLRVLALVLAMPAAVIGCGDDSPTDGGGGSGGGDDGGGGSGGEPVGGEGGVGGGEGGSGGGETLGDTCASPIEVSVALDRSAEVTGTVDGAADDFKSACADDEDNESAVEVVVAVSVDEDCTAQFTLASDFDGAISIREACDTEQFCFNATTAGTETTPPGHYTGGQTYFIVISDVDGSGGDYTLTASCATPACGDFAINPGESCDDGGTANGDGCDSTCLFEPADPEVDTCAGATASDGYPISSGETVLIPDPGTRTTLGATDDGHGTCQWDPVAIGANGYSADHIFKIIPDADGLLTFTLGLDEVGDAYCPQGNVEPQAPFDPGCWDYAIHVREDICDMQSSEVGCQDIQQAPGHWWDVETLEVAVEANKAYYVFVDGWVDYGDNSDRGEYVLWVDFE